MTWNHPLAGLDPTGHHAGLPGAADAAGAATAVGGVLRLGGSAAQQQQQLLLSGAPAGVGVTPRSAATAAVQLQLPLRHAVSRELQVYFDRVMGLILAPPSPADATSTTTVSPFAPAAGGGSMVGAQPGAAGAAAPGADSKQSSLLAGVLASVGADPGLHPLVPYFCKSIADGVVQYLGNLGVLHRFLALTRALLANPDVHLAPYLQQLLPAVVTCVVTKTLGERACVFGGSLPCASRGHVVCLLCVEAAGWLHADTSTLQAIASSRHTDGCCDIRLKASSNRGWQCPSATHAVLAPFPSQPHRQLGR